MTRKPVNFVFREQPAIRGISYGTYDLETKGLGGEFLDAVTFTGTGQRYRTIDDLMVALLDPPRSYYKSKKKGGFSEDKKYTWFAHNGGRYDFTYLAIRIRNYAVNADIEIRTIQQGTKIIALDIPVGERTVRIADSLPLLQVALDDAAESFAPYYAKQPHCPDHDFTKSDDVFYSPECEVCVAYMMRDAEALYYAYKGARKTIIDTFGVTPGLTTGSTAVKGWKATIPEGDVYFRQGPEREAFARRVGVGSIIYPGHTSDPWVPDPANSISAVTLDMTAAFAAQMLKGGYPTDMGCWTDIWHEELFGIYKVKAWCAEGTFPVIPYTHGKVRRFETGWGIAYITSEQYKYARECGYSLEVIEGIIHYRTADVFGPFIRKCQDKEYPPDGSKAPKGVVKVVKNMRNSLNGKFNIGEVMDSFGFGAQVPEGADPVLDDDKNEVPGVFTMPEPVEAPYCNPLWYAITVTRQQMAMIRLLRELPPDERGKVDTDSITTSFSGYVRLVSTGAVVMGRLYGQFKVEHMWLDHQSSAPKNYQGREIKPDNSQKQLNVCKGLPPKTMEKNREEHARAALGEKIPLTFSSVRSFQDCIKQNTDVPAIERTRSISIPATCLAWNWDKVTHEFSPHHNEVLAL